MKKKENSPIIGMENGNALDIYFADVSREMPLTAEEEETIARQYRAGVKTAADRLITGNLRYVVHVAKQYQGQGLSLSDLTSEGNIGLIKAAGNYNGQGRFVNYAEHLIRLHIEKAISEKTSHDDAIRRQYSFDAPLANNDKATMLDLLPNPEPPRADDQMEQRQATEDITAKIDRLNDREQVVVKAFYGIGQPVETLAEIAQRMDITRERARQIRNQAVRKIKRMKIQQTINA